MNLLLVVMIVLSVVALVAWIPFHLANRRQRALLRLLDGADSLEALLHQTRERMAALQGVVSRVPSDIGAVAQASLDAQPRVQSALKDLLEHRLWIARHGADATQKELDQACHALDRARATIADQLDRLDHAGTELAEVTQAAIEQAAREPAALKRNG